MEDTYGETILSTLRGQKTLSRRLTCERHFSDSGETGCHLGDLHRDGDSWATCAQSRSVPLHRGGRSQGPDTRGREEGSRCGPRAGARQGGGEEGESLLFRSTGSATCILLFITGHLRDLFMVLRFLLKASGNLLLKHLDVCCWKKSSGQMQTCYPHSCPSRSPTWERGLPSPTPGLLPGSLFSARMHRLDLHRLDSSPA